MSAMTGSDARAMNAQSPMSRVGSSRVATASWYHSPGSSGWWVAIQSTNARARSIG